ncbi:dihydrolipoyl dehydrogenase [Pusillimonas sp.]|uniref:dihydrolipoyl dehydrogenase n=1 Tax=Pusillimonas sp. TaxID=3040095 RepID=UPI0037C80BE5
MSTTELKVPDIGDIDKVDVIEVLVAVGDSIEAEQSLVTLESDKASMEIPAEHGGVVAEVLVKVGDKVAQGDTLVRIEAKAEAAASDSSGADKAVAASSDDASSSAQAEPDSAAQSGGAGETSQDDSSPDDSSRDKSSRDDSSRDEAAPPAERAAPAPQAAAYSGSADEEYDVVVLGAGPGGYSAAFRAADLGLKVALVERYSTLGGVCLNVGCIPSKALLHTVGVAEAAQSLAKHGISFGAPSIDLDALRAYKDGVIGKLTGGLAGMAKMRKVSVLTGVGRFVDSHHISVQAEGSAASTVKFGSAIIAAGSQSVKLPFLPEDKRIVDSTGALELASIPQKMLIIGGGIIGLEMGTVYSALGSRLDVVEMQGGLMLGADRDLVKVWHKMNDKRFDRIMLDTKTVSAEAKDDGIWVTFEGANAPSEPQRYDLVLQAVGRTPNGRNIDADKAGIQVTDRGFIDVDSQMCTNVRHIFAIGDIVGQPMLAHKAVHEGHVAAEAAAGQKSHFDARVIPSVAYTDPELAWVGLTEEEAKAQGIKVEKGLFPWAASGRAIANGRDEGFTKLLFDAETHRIVGGGIVGTHAGDLIGEVALAIEMNADAVDIGKTIHPHPTLGESIGMAAEAFEGVCTDLPPVRRK